ncbi:MAG: ABC transporter permease [Flavobacteriaceae bacterium]
MNIALHLARKMRQYRQHKSTVSSRIINIATVAVALGIAAILIAMAFSRGLQKEIRIKTSVFQGQILITPFENNESQVSLLPFKATITLKEEIQAHPEFDRMHAIAIKAGMLKTPQDFEGVLIKGVDANFEWSSLDRFLVEGSYPRINNEENNEILLSQIVANRLYLEVGDTVDAFFQTSLDQGLPQRRRFKIAGLYFSGFPDIDENLVYTDLRQIQRLNRWEVDQIGGYEVFIKDFSKLRATAEELYLGLPSELNSSALSDRYSSIFQWIALFDFNVLIILIVMLIVGVINMATALLVLILERSRMVGLLKTLGATHTLIQKIFLYNGILIMTRGLLFGNLVGLFIYFSQQQFKWISLDPQTYFVTSAPVALSWVEVISINVFFLGIASLLLWLPSKIILRMSPSVALRNR